MMHIIALHGMIVDKLSFPVMDTYNMLVLIGWLVSQ